MAHQGTQAAVTEEIADFAARTRYDDLPGEVIERGKIHILDAVGLSLCGAQTRTCEIAQAHIVSLRCGDDAAVFGTALRTAPRFAAFANGTAIHAHNFDDTNPQASPDRNGGIHATGAVLAAALAVGESEGRSGRALLEAYLVGVEVACKVNHAIGARHVEAGYHPTATLNMFGAAASVGRLRGLDAMQIRHALGIAASQAGGVRANFGALVEPLHSGHAAECGVAAADLASRGLTAAPDAIEARFGFFDAAGDGYNAAAIAGKLGAPWVFVDPGMWIKPYPSGALTHPAMTLLLKLIDDNDVSADQVARLRVGTNRRIADTLIHNRPGTALEAKFSMPFCVAMIVLERRAGLSAFTDEVVQRDDVRAMMEKIDYVTYEKTEPGYTNVTTFVDLTLTDGRTFSGRADFAKGSTQQPMSLAEVRDKFLGCADYADWPRHKADALIDAVARLEHVADIRDLTRLMQ